MLSLPSYIEAANISDTNIRFTWDNSDTQVAEGPKDTELVHRLGLLSQRANLAFAAALAEWVLGRFRPFPAIELCYHYVEACWAGAVDLRYFREVWEDYPHAEPWEDPVRGPSWLAMCRVEQSFEFLIEGGDPEFTVANLWHLVDHILPALEVFQNWSRIVIERMEQRYPRVADDPLGDVVPREFFDPARDVAPERTEELINRFLQGLSPRENPFLNTPQRMLEQGFTGTPYVFSLADDRASRGIG